MSDNYILYMYVHVYDAKLIILHVHHLYVHVHVHHLYVHVHVHHLYVHVHV